MGGTKKVGTSGRFGPRYGRRIRHKVKTIESVQRSKQECPKCKKKAIKRLAQGIYECRKCGAKIAGKAYTLE